MPYAVVVERTVPISRQRFFAELMDFGGVAKLSPRARNWATSASIRRASLGASQVLKSSARSGASPPSPVQMLAFPVR